MPDGDKKFKAEYDYARGWLANEANLAEDWRPLIKRLHTLTEADGFDLNQASALSDLRKQATWGDRGSIGHKTVTEDQSPSPNARADNQAATRSLQSPNPSDANVWVRSNLGHRLFAVRAPLGLASAVTRGMLWV